MQNTPFHRQLAFKAGECITPACDQAGALYLIRKGWAGSAHQLEDGRRHIGALYLPGELCDARWFHGPIVQSVVALSEVEADAIEARRLTQLLRQSSRLNELLWTDATRAHARASLWETCLAKRSALERVGHLSCEVFARRCRTLSAVKGTCEWLLQEADVADYCGLTRLHAKRQIVQLQRLGLARIRQKQLLVEDFGRLARLVHFDAARFMLPPVCEWTSPEWLALLPA